MRFKCDEAGPGSRAQIVEYVRLVLEHNTILDIDRNPTASFDKLASAMVYSILHRLDIEQHDGSLLGDWR